VTTTLSSSQRLPITAELSVRPGTSGMLNRAWPDHPCVTVTCTYKIINTRFKALERLLVFIVPSLQFSIFYTHLTRLSWGRMQCLEQDMHRVSSDRTHSFVTHSRKLRSSAYGTSLPLAQFFTSSEEGCSEEHQPRKQDQAPTQNNGCITYPPNNV